MSVSPLQTSRPFCFSPRYVEGLFQRGKQIVKLEGIFSHYRTLHQISFSKGKQTRKENILWAIIEETFPQNKWSSRRFSIEMTTMLDGVVMRMERLKAGVSRLKGPERKRRDP